VAGPDVAQPCVVKSRRIHDEGVTMSRIFVGIDATGRAAQKAFAVPAGGAA